MQLRSTPTAADFLGGVAFAMSRLVGDSQGNTMTVRATPPATTEADALARTVQGAKRATVGYLAGVNASLYLQASREIADNLCAMLGLDGTTSSVGMQAAVPIIASALGEAAEIPMLVAAANRAALAQGVVHGNAALSPFRDILHNAFAPLLKTHANILRHGSKVESDRQESHVDVDV